MTDPKDPYLTTDDAARRQGRIMLRSARFGTLACLEPETGDPLVSRVLLATDVTGDPTILVSALSAHTSALERDPRSSLLVGEPGKGDPLAHPRLSVRGQADTIDALHPDHERVRRRFLLRHPSAALYADFADFRFVRIRLRQGVLNGGFARAYRMERGDLAQDDTKTLAGVEQHVVDHMNTDHSDSVDRIVQTFGNAEGGGWSIATVDAFGFEVIRGDRTTRIEFEMPVTAGDGFRAAFVALAEAADRKD